MFVDAILEGPGKIQPKSKIFEKGPIKAIYSGMSSETKIINLKTQQSTILKFVIIETKPGDYQVPPIEVVADGKVYQMPETYFTVTKESYSTPPGHGGLFQRFFHEDNPVDESDSIFVKFQTSKSKAYIGEPIIGYFIIYYQGRAKPIFERNPNASISFPFFSSDLLAGVKVSYPEQVEVSESGRTGIFATQAYNREIFALTPLKAGKFKIGSTKFDYTYTNRIQFYTNSVHSEAKEIEIIPLPPNPPRQFSGEVGEMEMQLELSGNEVHAGNPWRFQVLVHGYGLCNRIKDPVLDLIPDSYPGKVVSTGVKRTQKFTEIRPNEYGFHCEAKFEYSIFSEKDCPEFWAEISFLNPQTGQYRTKSLQIPALHVLPPRPEALTKKDSAGEERQFVWSEYIQISTFLWIGLALGFAILGRFLIRTVPEKIQIQSYLKTVQEVAGSKTGYILEKSLIEKGFGEESAKFFRYLKDKYVDRKISDLFPIIDYREKEILENLVRNQRGEK